MAPSHSAPRVLEVCLISPSVAEASVPLTAFDVLWLFADPVERLFFYPYPHPTASFLESHLPSLKSSLSLTLQQFYTLAGDVRMAGDAPHNPNSNSNEMFEIYYDDDAAITLTVAESDDDFHELSAGGKRDLIRIQHLVPELSGSRATPPLFAVLVTVFPEHGVSIGLTFHRVVGDGASIVHFLKSWALACRTGRLPSPLPVYDRALAAQAPGLYNQMISAPTELAEDTGLDAQADIVVATFTLGQAHIQRLKQMVASSATEPVAHCSTFVVSCAYVWVCLVKTRGFDSERTAHFVFSVDCRARLDPAVPAAYFGNCLRPCFVGANVGDLIGVDGVVAASAAIGKAVEGLKDGILLGAEGWGRKMRSIVAEQPMLVAGSQKFRVYDTDFGWGRPQSVEIPSIHKTGAISLAESREDGDGVEIGLALEKNEMDEFEKQFYISLELLQDEV